MSTAQHTPGPWRCGDEYTHQFGFSCLLIEAGPSSADESLAIASVWADADEEIGGDEESEANARLISAAPDLLAACEEILEHGTDDWLARVQTIRAAIAKAKGTA